MTFSSHTFKGARVEVCPTMQALGDQNYICRVYPDKLKGDYYQGLLVVAGSRDDAAREAALEFNALYPNAEQIQL